MKEWLEKNKIYFETIMTLALSIASIVVSCSANRISDNQSTLIEAQKNIELEMASPSIDLVPEYDEDGNVTGIDIINSGGPLNRVEVSVYPFVNSGIIMGHRSYAKSIEFFPIVFSSNGKEKDMYKKTSHHTTDGILYTIQGTEIEEYANRITNRDISYDIYSLDSDYEVQETNGETSMVYMVESVSFEYLVKIEYSDRIEDKTKIDYFRVVTGIGYGNDASTGIIKIDLNNKNFSKLESILNGDDTVTLSYQPDEDFLEDDLKNLQKALIDACVARKNEENSSESN